MEYTPERQLDPSFYEDWSGITADYFPPTTHIHCVACYYEMESGEEYYEIDGEVLCDACLKTIVISKRA